MSNVLLSVMDLHAHYGLSHVLHGVNLEIKRGETLALMGRNGMGKTTLIKCLMGLVSPSSGDVKFREQDSKSLPTHLLARAGVAYVPEGRGIFKNLSVRENLLLAAARSVTNKLLDGDPELSLIKKQNSVCYSSQISVRHT